VVIFGKFLFQKTENFVTEYLFSKCFSQNGEISFLTFDSDDPRKHGIFFCQLELSIFSTPKSNSSIIYQILQCKKKIRVNKPNLN
jgi:hypothetical protein